MEKSKFKSKKSKPQFKIQNLLKNFTFGIAVLSFIFYLLPLYAMDVDLWNLPLPAKSEIVWKDQPIDVMGIKAKGIHLRCQLPGNEIISFYKDALEKNNWKLEYTLQQNNIFIFTRENKFFYLAVLESSKDLPCDVYLVTSPEDLAICKTMRNYLLQEEIAQDTPGKDFLDIPRYPGSKRRMNVFTPVEGAVLLYEVEAEPKEIASFYRQNLTSLGWKEEQMLSQKMVEEVIRKANPRLRGKVALLCFYRSDDSLVINISAPPQDFALPGNSKRSLIIIAKNMEKELSYDELSTK